MRVPYEMMVSEFVRVLKKYGFSEERAKLSASLFANASRDGVYTHGLNRFPRLINNIQKGCINVDASPQLKEQLGILLRYDGGKGPGDLNAQFCMNKAIEIAKKQTIGCVALANTNHWMRPGNYGLMAVEANCIGILWTNTMPNMPAWGGCDAKLGNNPIVMAIPHEDVPVVLDVAMSMFSYGKLESYARAGKELPVDGGFDRDQNITRDAGEIMETRQPLPIGYWKGSGLSLMLDLIVATLAGGRTTKKIGELEEESELSQVFIAICLEHFPDKETLLEQIHETVVDLQQSIPVEEGKPPYYPGQNMMRLREENMSHGIPVDKEIWNTVLEL